MWENRTGYILFYFFILLIFAGGKMDIAAIIPAYNEEKTIGSVLRALKGISIINRIIVVSDGSTDNTADIARCLGCEVIVLDRNTGKGGAMKAGVERCREDVILFLDADLIGLKKFHILELLDPVVSGRADMSIGVFYGGRLTTDIPQRLTPNLSGQRAVKRYIMESIPDLYLSRYGVEVAITAYAAKNNFKVEMVKLKNMSHYTKEEKLGFIKGLCARLRMYMDIVKCIGLIRMR